MKRIIYTPPADEEIPSQAVLLGTEVDVIVPDDWWTAGAVAYNSDPEAPIPYVGTPIHHFAGWEF